MTHRLVRRTLVLALFAAFAAPVAAAACPTDLPATMRAVRLHAAGGPEALRIESVPRPTPAPGEVLIRVHYASVNPVDWKLMQAGAIAMPGTPGGDLAGEIVAVGEGVEGWSCGDAVAGAVNQRDGRGSYAEYVAAEPTEIVRKPEAFSMAEAAAYPTVAVAAWRFLVAAAALQPDERVLIHGGAGGVGSMAVQIAEAIGAHVTATASARNLDYLRAIGADTVIDYRSTRFEDVAKDMDVVFDTVGGDTLARSPAVLKDGGRLVTAAGRPAAEVCASGRIVCSGSGPWDVVAGLSYVAPLIAADRLNVNIDREFPLAEAAAAVAMNREGHTRGKVVIRLVD